MYCWGWLPGNAGPGSLVVPPCPCDANLLGCPCSGVAPGAFHKAADGMPPGYMLHRSTAHGSGKALSAGQMGCTHTRVPLCTWTSWWGFLTKKEMKIQWVNSSKKGRIFYFSWGGYMELWPLTGTTVARDTYFTFAVLQPPLWRVVNGGNEYIKIQYCT